MSAFSYQHNHHDPFSLSPAQVMANESSSSFLYHHGQTDASSTEPRSSSICNVNGDDQNRIYGGSIEKKRSRHDSLLSPVKSKDTKGGSSKQKKPIEERKKAGEEPPAGCIHVRARRGQATDSHSLAERVRREKISERMKVLQGLVPGCDKVVGKALMLDEIINYVQSLQSQIEFLSMKLACVNPMLFDFSADYEYCLVNQKKYNDLNTEQFEELGSMTESQPMPCSLLEDTLIQPTTIDQGNVKEYEAMNMNPAPLLLQDQGPIPFSQENGGFFMQAGDQRLEFLNHIMLNNMRPFE